ncbi:MAG: XdhC family protein [Bacteroidota bacterium]
MSDYFFDTVKEHTDGDEPAAMAMIVRREVPSSGKPGDKAVITRKGEVKGWIGGGCTKGIVIKEALEAIQDNKPRLVSITPSGDTGEVPGVKYYKMTCQSGGSVDVYIEPIMSTTHILILGRSHIAQALARIAKATGYRVSIISDQEPDEMFPSVDFIGRLKDFDSKMVTSNTYAIVCTQGENDAQSLEKAIEANPRYLAFVSSRKKANSLFMGLKKSGVPIDKLSKIKTPAGLDINAKVPEEVAISILAEIIKEKRKEEVTEDSSSLSALSSTTTLGDDFYINPVCKIPVQKSTAKHVLEHEGEKVYFCCDGCKESFEKEPEAYL